MCLHWSGNCLVDSILRNNDLIFPRIQWNPGNTYPAAGIEQIQEFSVLSQENLFAADLLISSAELNPPKMMAKIITPNFWCALVIQWNSLFRVVHQRSVLWIFVPCWKCATGKILELTKDQLRDPSLFSSYPTDHISHSLLLKGQLTGSQDCLATQ